MKPQAAADSTKRVPWTYEEDELLRSLVHQIGAGRWTAIASHMPTGRNSKSCSLRWRFILDPEIVRSTAVPFSRWEQQVILAEQASQGNKWAAIAKLLPGRVAGDIKNFYHQYTARAQTPPRPLLEPEVEVGQEAGSPEWPRSPGEWLLSPCSGGGAEIPAYISPPPGTGAAVLGPTPVGVASPAAGGLAPLLVAGASPGSPFSGPMGFPRGAQLFPVAPFGGLAGSPAAAPSSPAVLSVPGTSLFVAEAAPGWQTGPALPSGLPPAGALVGTVLQGDSAAGAPDEALVGFPVAGFYPLSAPAEDPWLPAWDPAAWDPDSEAPGSPATPCVSACPAHEVWGRPTPEFAAAVAGGALRPGPFYPPPPGAAAPASLPPAYGWVPSAGLAEPGLLVPAGEIFAATPSLGGPLAAAVEGEPGVVAAPVTPGTVGVWGGSLQGMSNPFGAPPYWQQAGMDCGGGTPRGSGDSKRAGVAKELAPAKRLRMGGLDDAGGGGAEGGGDCGGGAGSGADGGAGSSGHGMFGWGPAVTLPAVRVRVPVPSAPVPFSDALLLPLPPLPPWLN